MDDSLLRDRLEQLEARVAQLERLLGERPAGPLSALPPAPPPAAAPLRPPTPTPAPAPTPGPRRERPAAPPPLPPDGAFAARAVPPPPEKDFERFVGLAVLGRVGIGAVLLAAAYFGQLGWTQLGPGARTALVYACGLALIGVGAWLRPRVDAKYTALLWGGGVALTYLAGVLGHMHYGMLSSTAAIVSLLASAALGQVLAHRLRLELLATVALGGAYAAPVLVGSPSPTPTAFFTLLLALHAWAAWTEHRWRWHQARGLAVIATAGLVYAWYVNTGIVSVWSFVWHVEVVWLLLIAPEVLAAVQRREVSLLRAVLAGVGGMYVHAQLLGHLFKQEEPTSFGLGAALVLLAAGAALVPRAVALGSWLARVGSCVLPFGVILWAVSLPIELGAAGTAGVVWWCVGGLAGASALLVAVRPWTRVAELGVAIAAPLAIAFGYTAQLGRGQTAVVLAIPLLLLVTGRGTIARLAGLAFASIGPFFALQPLGRFGGGDGDCMALAFALVSGAATLALFVGARARDRVLVATAAVGELLVLAAWLMISATAGVEPAVPPLTPFWNTRAGALAVIVALAITGRTLLSAADGPPRAVLGATALAGLYVGGLLEVLDIAAPWSNGARDVATSFYTLAFAGVLLAAGFWKQVQALRWIALVAFGVIALKIVVWDLKDFDTPLRVLATGVLGGVLLLAAWAYARTRHRGDQPSS